MDSSRIPKDEQFFSALNAPKHSHFDGVENLIESRFWFQSCNVHKNWVTVGV